MGVNFSIRTQPKFEITIFLIAETTEGWTMQQIGK